MDHKITYLLSIPSTEFRTKSRSELLNGSLVPLRIMFGTGKIVSSLVRVVLLHL